MFALGAGGTALPVLHRCNPVPAPAPTPAPPPAPGIAATSFATAPAVHFHPNAQAAVVTKSGNVVTACPDLKGLAALSAAGGTGGVEMTDALGRKFWRYEGAQLSQIAAAFASNPQNVAVVFVGRSHQRAGNILSLGLNGGTAPTTATGLINTYTTGSRPSLNRPLGKLFAGTEPNIAHMAIGAQLQVIGVRSVTTANGGLTTWVNNQRESTTQTAYTSAFAGAELGRFATGANGYGAFDLYEIALWNAAPSMAQMDAAVAGAVANFAIPPITDTLVLEGDSRVYGSNSDVSSGTALAMVLSAPGAGYVPEGFRVLSYGASGAQIPHMVTRRDDPESIFATKMNIGGQRHVAFVVGANDGAPSGDANYGATAFNTVARGDAVAAAEKALIHNGGSTGYLGRGWTVTRMVEPIVQASPSVSILQQRIRIREAAYLTDCLAGPGQTYEGKLRRIELANVAVGALKPFDQPANLPNAFVDGDGVHPNRLGVALYASGGDTPALGWGAVV